MFTRTSALRRCKRQRTRYRIWRTSESVTTAMTFRQFVGQRTKKELSSILELLALYCQEPDPQAKGATDLVKAIKQFTLWPTSDLLKSLEFNVTCLASLERKKPPLPLWRAFQLVDKRMPSL